MSKEFETQADAVGQAEIKGAIKTQPGYSMTNQEVENDTGHVVPRRSRILAMADTIFSRMGWKSIYILIGSVIIEIVAMGFLGFLWYSDVTNHTWWLIVVNRWVTRAVTLTSLALRIAIALQAAICLSMLAAITLEHAPVSITNIAEISLMRVGAKTDLFSVITNYLYPMAKRRLDALECLLVALTVGLLATTTLSQFASTALLGDVSPQQVPGKPGNSDLLYDYNFTFPVKTLSFPLPANALTSGDGKNYYSYNWQRFSTHVSYWETKTPPFWPTFAEYSEPPPAHTPPDVSDTGPSLRAFIPLAQAQDRQIIRNYTGKAMVFDSRVTCQKPNVTEATWEFLGANNFNGDNLMTSFGTISGIVRPTKKTDMQNPRTENEQAFKCSFANDGGYTPDAVWSICELPAPLDTIYTQGLQGAPSNWPAGLNSMLRAQDKNQTGAAYLLFAPSNTVPQVPVGVPVDTKNSSYVTVIAKGGGNITDLTLAMTICYAAYDISRSIDAYSDSNRTEPSAQFDKASQKPNMTNLIDFLTPGYVTKPPGSKLLSPEQRGVLHLKPRKDWSISTPDQYGIEGPDQLPYIRGGLKGNYSNVFPYPLFALEVRGEYPWASPGNNMWTAILSEQITLTTFTNFTDTISPVVSAPNTVYTAEWVVQLFKVLKAHPAVALQSILTSLVGIAYYDRIGQYDHPTMAKQIFFATAESPGGPDGTRRTAFAKGFAAVIAILALHLILVATVVILFMTKSSTCRIGDGWQAIAQMSMSEELRPIMQTAAGRGGGDIAVKQMLRTDTLKDVRVRTVARGDTVRFESSS